MSESEIPVNPHGDYHEEDYSKVEDIDDTEVVQTAAIPNGMEWIQQALGAIRIDMQAQAALSANLQTQFDHLEQCLCKICRTWLNKKLTNNDPSHYAMMECKEACLTSSRISIPA